MGGKLNDELAGVNRFAGPDAEAWRGPDGRVVGIARRAAPKLTATGEEVGGANMAETMGRAGLDREQFCYLETVWRSSGRLHTVEMWFAAANGAIYLLAGGGEQSDWVRNLRRQGRVSVRVGRTTFGATAEIVADPPEERRVRELLATKYYGWRDGTLPNEWARTALPVELRLDPAAPAEPSAEVSDR